MNQFDQFVQYRCLDFKFKYNRSSEELLEDHISDPASSPLPVKNVCAALSLPLVERMDNAISLLGISKRRFVELAVIEALDRVDQIAQEVDVFENLSDEEGESES